MPDKQPPTVDPQAARRWQSMPAEASPWLHEEVARRMQERLQWIKRQPDSWVHWQPLRGGMQAHALLAQRYPKAVCTALEASIAGVERLAQTLEVPWWKPQHWLLPKTEVATQVDRPAQMLWSNMALHMSDDPQGLMTRWHKALEVDGFLMFSCLGPDTLKELRGLYQSMDWPAPSHEFTDMHDWGDMLVAAGFAEPVMDTERITLTFETPERLLLELRGLGRNLHSARFSGLRGRAWHQQLADALRSALARPEHGGQLVLTFEVIYGHAFKPAPRLTVRPESSVSLQAMRDALAMKRGATES